MRGSCPRAAYPSLPPRQAGPISNRALHGSQITTTGDAVGEHGIDFGTLNANNLLGTATITSSTISGMYQHGLTVENIGGTLTMTVTDTTFASNHDIDGGDGILFQAGGNGTTAATMTLIVNETTADGCQFQNLNGDAIQTNTEAPSGPGSTVTLNVDGCTVSNVGGGTAAINIGGIGGSQNRGFFDIRNNTLTGVELIGIAVFAGDDSELVGVILNNDVATLGDNGMAILADGGVFGTPSPIVRAAVRGNTVDGGEDVIGLRVRARDGTDGRIDLQLEGNTVLAPDLGMFGGGDGVSIAAQDGMSLCLDVQDAPPVGANNTSAASGAGTAAYRLSNSGTGTFFLEGYGGGDVGTFFTSHFNVGSLATSGTITGGTCTPP